MSVVAIQVICNLTRGGVETRLQIGASPPASEMGDQVWRAPPP
jgi:hypothetical protein